MTWFISILDNLARTILADVPSTPPHHERRCSIIEPRTVETFGLALRGNIITVFFIKDDNNTSA
jgi:hypothetical protein